MARLISSLPVGSKVVDRSWQWEHKTGYDFTGSGKVKPVVFRIVAKNHRGYPNNSVTLLSEEIIANHLFDDSAKGSHGRVHNSWEESGMVNASKGIRKFLNGSSYTGRDRNLYPVTFYDSMGNDFKSAILETNLVNKDYYSETEHFTKDKIFLPSQTEYAGGSGGTNTIGINYEYFSNNSSRIAKLDGSNSSYWTRSPGTIHLYPYEVRLVDEDGSFFRDSYIYGAGVRPALNLKSDISVSDTPDYNGVYTIVYNTAPTIVLDTTNNRTLYENDVLNITGNARDTNSGDVVSVKYSINGGTVRAMASAISTGANIPFNKSLTFKQNKLLDGGTAITGDLAEGTQHTLKVWAEDDQGGKSTEQTRVFYVVPNRPAQLTINPFSPSEDLINTDRVTIDGSVSDPDGNNVTVSYKIANGSFREVYSGTDDDFQFQVQLLDLVEGKNTITIQAEDSYGAKTVKTLEVTKDRDEVPLKTAVARYKLSPPNGNAKGIVLWIEREVGDLEVSVEISAGMNGEAENFVPMTKSSIAFVREGIEEDEWTFEADSPKENIIIKITMKRANTNSNKGITLISGVLS